MILAIPPKDKKNSMTLLNLLVMGLTMWVPPPLSSYEHLTRGFALIYPLFPNSDCIYGLCASLFAFLTFLKQSVLSSSPSSLCVSLSLCLSLFLLLLATAHTPAPPPPARASTPHSFCSAPLVQRTILAQLLSFLFFIKNNRCGGFVCLFVCPS
jgi:hypothetical protein